MDFLLFLFCAKEGDFWDTTLISLFASRLKIKELIWVETNRVVELFQEEQKELDEILAKRAKKGKKVEDKPMEEKTTMHC